MELNLSTLAPVAVSLALTLGGLAVGHLIRRFLRPRVSRATKGITSPVDNILVAALRSPSHGPWAGPWLRP